MDAAVEQQAKPANFSRMQSSALINIVDQVTRATTLSNAHTSDMNEMGIPELRRLVETLKEEIQLIKKEMKRKEDLSKEINGFLKDDLSKNKNKMAEMEQTLDEYKEKLKQADETKRVELFRMKQHYDTEIQTKEQALQEFQQQMSQLDKIKLEKRFSDEIADHKQRQINELQKQHDEEMYSLKMSFIEYKRRQHEEQEARIKRLQEENEQSTISQIGEKTREIRLANIEILKHSKKCEEDFVAYGKVKEQLEADRKRLLIEQKLHKEAIKMYATKSILLAKEIKEGKQKVIRLEGGLTQAVDKVGRADREKQDLRELHREELRAKDGEIDLLESKLKKRTNELLRLKKIAKKILVQRSELEGFFFEALEFVRNQKEREMRLQRRSQQLEQATLRSRKSLPRLEQRSRRQSLAVSRSLDSQIEDAQQNIPNFQMLSWEDKEQVISLLFAKLSSGIGGITPEQLTAAELDDAGRADWLPYHHTTPASSKPSTSQGHRRPVTGGNERPISKVEFFVTEGEFEPSLSRSPSRPTSQSSSRTRRLNSALSATTRDTIEAVQYNPPD